jgi:hypothetical protein
MINFPKIGHFARLSELDSCGIEERVSGIRRRMRPDQSLVSNAFSLQGADF